MYIPRAPGSSGGHPHRAFDAFRYRGIPCARPLLLGTIGAAEAGGEGAMTSVWSDTGRLPLAGLTVIDFGQIFQGPNATFLLGKGGADVIKVEPLHGEPLRRRALPG